MTYISPNNSIPLSIEFSQYLGNIDNSTPLSISFDPLVVALINIINENFVLNDSQINTIIVKILNQVIENFNINDFNNNYSLINKDYITRFFMYDSNSLAYILGAVINETLGLSDNYSFPGAGYMKQIIESLSLNDNFVSMLRTKEIISESIGLNDSNSASNKIVLVLGENFNFSEDIISKQNAIIQILEDFTFEDDLFFNLIQNNEITYDYDTWFMNYETKSFTRFTNFYFNSYLKMDGKYYIANDKGLFLVDGNKDDLKDISATIKTGLLKFGSGIKARVDQAFLYAMNDGTMKIKVLGSDGLEYVYSTSQASLDETVKRVKFGKGRTLTYIQFELDNDGATDFKIDDIKFTKQITSRIT